VNIKTVLVSAAVSTIIVGCGGGAVVAAGDMFTDAAAGQPVSAACGQPIIAAPAAGTGTAKVDGFTAEQVANATVIVQVGQQMNIPPRGWVVAVATAMQESNLHNVGNLGARNDHDSLGLFQQRPSQGWGSPAQVTDPQYASRKFYEHLQQVTGWQNLPLTVAAQKVQRSGFPNAYAKHEPKAAALVNATSGGAAQAGPTPGVCAAADQVTAGGWTTPVHGTVGSGFRTSDRPTHQGVDLIVPKRTAILAAASGTVIKAICDPSTAKARGCDVDGSSGTPGCGWYVDIAHAEGVITRYCHMIVAPLVSAGDQVTAGQQIGWSGTSGNSSGPHVHFEVHTGGDGHASGAVNPVTWMRDHGASLDQ